MFDNRKKKKFENKMSLLVKSIMFLQKQCKKLHYLQMMTNELFWKMELTR